MQAIGEIEVQLKLLEARKMNLMKQALEHLKNEQQAKSTETRETQTPTAEGEKENQFTGSPI